MKVVWPLELYRVSGDSMTPTYSPGDVVVGWKWYRPKVDDVVLIRFTHIHIKRIKQLLDDDARVWVEGDNPDHSTDSRDIGAIPASNVVAKVLFRV